MGTLVFYYRDLPTCEDLRKSSFLTSIVLFAEDTKMYKFVNDNYYDHVQLYKHKKIILGIRAIFSKGITQKN